MIATLLMIAVAVAASVVMYSWVNSMVKSQATQSQTAIRIDQVQFFNYKDTMQISVSVRNTGTTGAVIQTLYIYRADAQIAKVDKVNMAVPAGVLSTFGFTTAQAVGGAQQWYAEPVDATNQITLPAGELKTSSAYMIRMVTDNGFSVEGTYYTPNNFPGALHHFTFAADGQPSTYTINDRAALWSFKVTAMDYYEKPVVLWTGTLPTTKSVSVILNPPTGASLAAQTITASERTWTWLDGVGTFTVAATIRLSPEPAAGTGYTITVVSSADTGNRGSQNCATFKVLS